MKIATMRKLDDVAKACVAGLESEIAYGLTTPEKVREVQSRTKNPTRLEIIKTMIRSDLKKVGAARTQFFATVSNAMKSAEQSNYLANAIDARIKRRAWTDRSFDATYRELFGVRPRARSAKKR